MELFNLGLPKSGTTTLHEALRRSGLRSAHWKVPRRIIGRNITTHFNAGRDPLTDLREYDAITQADYISDGLSFWPQMDIALLTALRAHHPECRLLLWTRAPAKVASSILRWHDLRQRLGTMGAPGLAPVDAGSEAALVAWIEGHYAQMRRHFGHLPDFMEIDVEDPGARDKLGAFLDRKITWWGKSNVNKAA